MGELVVGELTALGGVWTGRIRAPHQKSACGDGFTIRRSSFIRSLRPVLDMPLMAVAKPGPAQLALLVKSYWDGIATVLPEPFDPANDPRRYTIQQEQGAMVLHSVLPRLIEVLPSCGKRLDDSSAYAELLHDMPTLRDEISADQSPVVVSGAAFWRSGPDGGAWQFRGDVERAQLCARLRAFISTVVPAGAAVTVG